MEANMNISQIDNIKYITNDRGDKIEAVVPIDLWYELLEKMPLNELAKQNSGINVYPNPTTNLMNVSSTNKELLEVGVYDITSRKIMYQQFVNSISIDTETLSKGIYFYEISNKNGMMKTGKVVKE